MTRRFEAIAIPMPDDVRALRERHELTQAAAAGLVYVTPNAWQKWERGDRAMDRRTWELMLFKLGELKPTKRTPVSKSP